MSFADLLPGQNAETVRDHWWWRPGWHVGRRFYAFHITFGGNDEILRMVTAYRQALAGLTALTIVPDEWLHLTVQGIGFADERSPADVGRIAERATEAMAPIGAFDVEFGEIVVADEAIVMPADPPAPVQLLRRTARAAIADVLGQDQVTEDPDRFRPHISVAYLAAEGPAAPYVNALAANRPRPVRVSIDRMDIIQMHRDNRMYEWTIVATLPLERRAVGSTE